MTHTKGRDSNPDKTIWNDLVKSLILAVFRACTTFEALLNLQSNQYLTTLVYAFEHYQPLQPFFRWIGGG
jgi:hypothetical protein